MAVHDTACAEPGGGRSCPGIRSPERFGKGRERVRALLEIQLRPGMPGASAPRFRRRPRGTAASPAEEGVPGAKVLPFPPAASS